MDYIFDSNRPIYLQIIEIIKNNIISGIYNPGDKIPSVREFAATFKVNPNTIVKSLYFLEIEGLIYTDRTNGKFITNDLSLIKKNKEIVAKEKINTFFNDMENLGYSRAFNKALAALLFGIACCYDISNV